MTVQFDGTWGSLIQVGLSESPQIASSEQLLQQGMHPLTEYDAIECEGCHPIQAHISIEMAEIR
jgi:hypothetical protein